MPTALDRAMHSKVYIGSGKAIKEQSLTSTHSGFAGMVTAAAAWAIWGSDIFPAESDPTGDPETWTVEEMKRWLSNVCAFFTL
ncbi:hypothetical protein G4B84_004871 [Aspergillus flavus NRRL3357]|nr:uncharacterized protein G4B84_004871 [Aspergillus flavus NRRL3357]QMW29536.1 hypothetical protein G4B84_004871 [Aspergillus flavus NRRL3357]QMW41607.1 hypothetical protein G4B11_004931 [Aspergillus flavus]